MINEYLILVAAGSGSRMKSDVPKQFIEVNGKEIIVHTLEKFFNYNSNIRVTVVLHNDFLDVFHLIKAKYFPNREIKTCIGGETRFHSVKNGLNTIDDLNSVVGIHDAARPLVSRETITRCFLKAKESGNAIPCIEMNESIREVSAFPYNKAVPRSNYRIVQTPQCFDTALIKRAFNQEYNNTFTDDATVLEGMEGHMINIVEGNEENIKITYPKDILLAKHLIK